MTKRVIPAIVAALASAGLLAGCSSDADTPGALTSEVTDGNISLEVPAEWTDVSEDQADDLFDLVWIDDPQEPTRQVRVMTDAEAPHADAAWSILLTQIRVHNLFGPDMEILRTDALGEESSVDAMEVEFTYVALEDEPYFGYYWILADSGTAAAVEFTGEGEVDAKLRDAIRDSLEYNG